MLETPCTVYLRVREGRLDGDEELELELEMEIGMKGIGMGNRNGNDMKSRVGESMI